MCQNSQEERITATPEQGEYFSSRRNFWSEVKVQSQTAVPTVLSNLLYRIPWLISLRFVGNIGSQELAAAALATTLCNVTGMSLSVGLSFALSTLAGQARGDCLSQNYTDETKSTAEASVVSVETDSLLSDKKKQSNRQPVLTLLYLYRGLFIQLLFVIPVGVWWLCGIESTLLALGQGPVLSQMTDQYLRILTPGLWSFSINMTLTTWLQAIGLADIPAYAAAVGLALHIPLNLLFVSIYGYLGVASATVCFQLVQPVLILSYLLGTSHGRSRVLKHCGAGLVNRDDKVSLFSGGVELKLAVKSLSGICSYLGLALPGIIVISEWWASEVTIFLAGRLAPNPDFALSGMSIYQCINSFCFMIPVGCSVATATRVATLLGQGRPNEAEFSGYVGVACAALLSFGTGSILWWTPHTTFPSLFTPDPNVIQQASQTLPLLAFYVFADGVQTTLNGILKGCGRQRIAMPIVVVAYWIVGVPLAYHLTFVRNDGFMCQDDFYCGIRGLVTGMTTGTWIHLILMAMAVLGTTRWPLEARRAQERLAVDKVHQREEKTDDAANGVEIISI